MLRILTTLLCHDTHRVLIGASSSSLRSYGEVGDLRGLGGVAAGVGLELARVYLPAVLVDAVVGEVVRGEVELYALGCAGLEVDALEAFQLFGGALDFGGGVAEVELDYVGAGALAVVGYVERDGDGGCVAVAFDGGLDVAVAEGGVGETEAEGEERLLVGGEVFAGVVAIAVEEAFGVVDGDVAVGVGGRVGVASGVVGVVDRIVGPGAGEAEGQVAFGGACAEEDLGERGAAGLARVVVVEESWNGVDPGLRVDATARGEDDDGVFIERGDGADESVLAEGKLEGAVEAFALGPGAEAYAENDGVGGGGDLAGGVVDEVVLAADAEAEGLAGRPGMIDEREVDGLIGVQWERGGEWGVAFAMLLIEDGLAFDLELEAVFTGG